MECPLMGCTTHSTDAEHCESCINNHEITVGLIEINRQLIQKRREKESKIEKLRALITVAESKIKVLSKDEIAFEDSFTPKGGVPLSEYLQRIILPSDLFSIVTREDLTVAFLIQTKFIPATLKCLNCRLDAQIVY